MAEATHLPTPSPFRGRGAAAADASVVDTAPLPLRSGLRQPGGAERESRLPEPAGLPPVEYPETDGQPMPDSGYQDKSYRYVVDAVYAHFEPRPEVYVAGNQFIYLEEGNNKNCVGPDLFVVMNGGRGLRDSYMVWEEAGGLPEFVMEIVSPSTWQEDMRKKRVRYAALGIGEYWLHDPRGRFLDPGLEGNRLVGGVYEPLPRRVTAAGELRMRSETLGLELRLVDGELRFYDPEKGRYLIDHSKALAVIETERAGRLAAEAKVRAAEAGRRASETKVRAAEAARRASETERIAADAARRTAEAKLRAAEARIAELERSR